MSGLFQTPILFIIFNRPDIAKLIFEVIRKAQSSKLYVDTKKQGLFTYVDMVYSCKRFAGTFSVGASVAACFNKPFSVIWPYSAISASNYNFRFKNGAGVYIK